MTMSTPTKEVGKPKLASGQILDEVMRGVDTWNGEPHGFLRGRIALVELAGPVVKVFVRLALKGLTVFPRPSSSKRGGHSWRDCLQFVKTMLYSPINGLPLKVDLDDAARRAEFARTRVCRRSSLCRERCHVISPVHEHRAGGRIGVVAVRPRASFARGASSCPHTARGFGALPL